MVTKEQCLLDRIISVIEYGRNNRIAKYVLAAFNEGKKYTSDMIFQNDERGLDQGLQGYSPSFIVYSLIGDDTKYDPSAPFFTVDSGIRSIDGYDFQRMLTPEDSKKLLNNDVLDELDDSDIMDAFDCFVHENYPQMYNNLDFDWLYVMGYRTEYDMLKADWTKLVQELQQYAQQQKQVSEAKAVKLTGNDLRRMTNKILKEIVNKK